MVSVKMELPVTHSLMGCSFLSLISYAVFLRGFFPLKTSIPGHSSLDRFPTEPVTTPQHFDGPFDRMILILIDALRADFVLPGTNSESRVAQMKFVGELIKKNEAKAFVAKAHPPTVTLPRIKALTSGSIPGFIDVVLNFDSGSLTDDNIISQLKHAGQRVHFYGDDTWMKLFPDHFTEADGTTSFFVSDYTEVDVNVTRHLDDELAADDWDVLILHYLGLDHIGHLAGPLSPLIGPKLAEMDNVVKTLFSALQLKDTAEQRRTLLVLCGDHGMSDQGSHGGATASETATPAVFMSHHVDWANSDTVTDIHQIDLAPTLSVLLGLPIPQNSLGCMVTTVLEAMLSPRQVLSSAYLNAQQISMVLKENVDNIEREAGYLLYGRAVESHRSWLRAANTSVDTSHLTQHTLHLYTEAVEQMRQRITANLTQYDMHAMLIAIACVWMVLLCVLYCVYIHSQGHRFVRLSLPCIGLSALCAGVGGMLHVTVCTSNSASGFLCSSEQPLSLITAALLLCFLTFCISTALSLLITAKYTSPHQLSLNHYTKVEFIGWHPAVLFTSLVAGGVGHSLSLMSSSFVEEEHQTWYFLSSSSVLLTAAVIIVKLLSPVRCVPDSSTGVPLNAMSSTQEQHHEVPLSGSAKSPSVSRRPGLRGAAACVMVLVLCRVAREWNRTGDKWAHLPDLGDWLVRPDNIEFLSILSGVALVASFVMLARRLQSLLAHVLVAAALAAVYCYRAATGSFTLPWLSASLSTKGVREAQFVYAVIAILAMKSFSKVIYKIVRYRMRDWQRNRDTADDSGTENQSEAHSVWQCLRQDCMSFWQTLTVCFSLLALLLARPHNIPLLFLIFILESTQSKAIKDHSGIISCSEACMLYLTLGQASFFYQGNSNSIATVDVGAGYTGLEAYHPPVIGLLMCLATYSGPLYWWLSLMLLLLDVYSSSCKSYRESLADMCCVYATSRALPLALYTVLVTVQRYHLFVWTVFSPKLLYEGMLTVIVTVLISVASIQSHVIK